jgi:uncharacterized membrane protein
VTAVLVVIGYLWKASCALPGQNLGLTDITARMCLTDIGGLWGGRGLADHQFPYIHAVFTAPQGLTGAVEYPVLNGMLIWLVGLGAHDALSFLTLNAIVLGICAVVVTILLRGLGGKRAWLWAASPAVLIYVVYNWDTWTVAAATAGVAALAMGRRTSQPSTRATFIAGALFGLGGALKIYPLLLLLPLMCMAFHQAHVLGAPWAQRIGRALIPAVGAGIVLLASNLPLMIINFQGWMSPIRFQSHRQLREDTMSVWYWILRPFGHPDSDRIQPLVNVATLGITALVVLAVLVVGWRLAMRRGGYPLLAVSLAVVAAYVAFGKVSSPQYMLWLIPLVALTVVRVPWIVALYVVDTLMFTAWYQMFGQREAAPDLSRSLDYVVFATVVLRFGLIVLIAILALRSDSPHLPRWRDGRENALEHSTEASRREHVSA